MHLSRIGARDATGNSGPGKISVGKAGYYHYDCV